MEEQAPTFSGYTFISKLSFGATSNVYKYQRTCDNETVAIKVFKPNCLQTLDKEKKILDKVKNNSHVIQLLDQLENSLVFEYLPNYELYDYLAASNSKFPTNVARYYFKQIIETIQFIHGQHVSHMDLKPSNMMLDEHFELRIIDFGYSQTFTANSAFHCKVGTENYMSPQVYNLQPFNPEKNEVFSLGVILFEIVKGFSPYYNCASHADKLYRYFLEEKSSTYWNILKNKFNIPLTDSFIDLINKMIAPKEADRISVEEVLKHPWMLEEEIPSKEFVQDYMSRLRSSI